MIVEKQDFRYKVFYLPINFKNLYKILFITYSVNDYSIDYFRAKETAFFEARKLINSSFGNVYICRQLFDSESGEWEYADEDTVVITQNFDEISLESLR